MSDYDRFMQMNPQLERYHDLPAQLSLEIASRTNRRDLFGTQRQPDCDKRTTSLSCNCKLHRRQRG